mmetsp:Transcript_54552/g.145672  ORF Transcript_54552/g.145672 Transcript_54552/m.145672 type:complete len:309 (+) Transcript_54552:1364-2290(+)
MVVDPGRGADVADVPPRNGGHHVRPGRRVPQPRIHGRLLPRRHGYRVHRRRRQRRRRGRAEVPVPVGGGAAAGAGADADRGAAAVPGAGCLADGAAAVQPPGLRDGGVAVAPVERGEGAGGGGGGGGGGRVRHLLRRWRVNRQGAGQEGPLPATGGAKEDHGPTPVPAPPLWRVRPLVPREHARVGPGAHGAENGGQRREGQGTETTCAERYVPAPQRRRGVGTGGLGRVDGPHQLVGYRAPPGQEGQGEERDGGREARESQGPAGVGGWTRQLPGGFWTPQHSRGRSPCSLAGVEVCHGTVGHAAPH